MIKLLNEDTISKYEYICKIIAYDIIFSNDSIF